MVESLQARSRSSVWSLASVCSRILSSFVLYLALVSPASADLFTVDFASGPDNFSASFDNVDDAFDQLTTSNLQAALPSYTDPVSTATILVDYRGLDMNFAFATSNSTELTLSIPELNINESFIGLTRDDSKDLLVEFLEGDGADTVNRIQQELARVSSTDPVAGNPGSLMGQAVDTDFALATAINPVEFAHTPGGRDLLQRVMRTNRTAGETRDSLGETDSMAMPRGESDSEQVAGPASDGEVTEGDPTMSSAFDSPGSVFSVDLSHRSLDLDGEKSSTDTLTFEYEYYFDDPLKVVRFKMPLAITDTEGATSYHANAGIDFSFPLTRSWSLTPGVSYGVGGSEDLGGGASVNGLSLTSTYRLVHGDYMYTIGNMVGRYETGSVSLGDYEIDPEISNTVLRNGLIVFRPSIMFNMPTMVQVFVIDTRFSGDELFTEHYYELGFSMGLITDEALISEDTFNLGLTYLDSTDADITGYKINFGYRF